MQTSAKHYPAAQYETRIRSMDFTAFRLEIFARLLEKVGVKKKKETFVKSIGFQ